VITEDSFKTARIRAIVRPIEHERKVKHIRSLSVLCIDCKEALAQHRHHPDMCHGAISPETVLLCASCHRQRHFTPRPNLDRLPIGMNSLPIDTQWDYDNHRLVSIQS
jgi:hypothetical protein